jgi:hypothetical protein
MMLKRIIENIIVYNIGKKWRIKVQYKQTRSEFPLEMAKTLLPILKKY